MLMRRLSVPVLTGPGRERGQTTIEIGMMGEFSTSVNRLNSLDSDWDSLIFTLVK